MKPHEHIILEIARDRETLTERDMFRHGSPARTAAPILANAIVGFDANGVLSISDFRSALIRAAALIAAEIERLDGRQGGLIHGRHH